MQGLPATRRIDTSRWPVLRYTGPTRVTDAEMSEVMEEAMMLRQLGRMHGLILDVRKTEGLTPVQRRMITDRMQATEEAVKATCVGLALCFDSVLLRGILTAIFWVRSEVVPTRVFKTPEDAEVWLRSMLAAREGETASL